MDSRIAELRRIGDDLFAKRLALVSLWQDFAQHVYPERADFIYQRSIGYDFGATLTTSYPVIARRELANAFTYMLRPPGQDWFSLSTNEDGNEDDVQARAWLEDKAAVMRRAMRDRASNFDRATTEGDNDFAVFGQCILSLELGRNADTLLYKCHHPRDVVWTLGYDEQIVEVHRNWKAPARVLNSVFRGNVSPRLKQVLEKEPNREIKCRHIVISSEYYEGKTKWKTPWVSIVIDLENDFVLEEKGIHHRFYIIPRWLTVSGFQYAYSPAMVAAIAEARTLQAVTLTLLEAGQKSVDPPMLVVGEALRGDINMFAGGVTHIDAQYDERLGEALRPLNIDRNGLPMGMQWMEHSKQLIADAFFLNKIALPPSDGRAMTATEVNERMKEYIRNALPLFAPMEAEYNGALCEETFDLMMRNGAFGPIDDIPQSLRGQKIHFRFQSPISQSAEAAKGQTFMEAQAMLAQAVGLDPGVKNMVNAREAMKDALHGIRVPADWLRSDDEMDAIAQQEAQQAAIQQALATTGQAAQVAEQVGNAGQALNGLTQGQAQ